MVLPPIIQGIASDIAADALGADMTEEQIRAAYYAFWQSVSSSAISEVRWQEETMFVRFTNGYEYSYDGVPMTVFEEFLTSTSKGKFFNAVIKPNYSQEKAMHDGFYVVWNYFGRMTISSVPFVDEADANWHADTLRARKGVSKVTVVDWRKKA